MMPPVQGKPGPPKPPRRTVARRRALATLGLVAAAGLVVAVALFAIDRHDRSTPATTAVAPPLRIVFPEGFTRREMAARITAVRKIAEAKRDVTPTMTAPGYLYATARSKLPGVFARDGRTRSLEGFLFPATYDFTAATTSPQFVQEQLQAFRENWAKVNLRYARSKNLTPYDVLIIASMIEKEALAPEERALVSAVIYNRLHRRMPLGIDATLRYGLHIPPTQSIRESQILSDNPYNTRRRRGLTPTPISNPGLAAMQAAAHPAKVDYLYYVRKPDKQHHFFTSSYAAFLKYAKAHGYGR